MKKFYFLIIVILFSCTEKQLTPKKLEENTFYDKAFIFLEKKQQDSAFYYLNMAKNSFQLKNDNLGIGKVCMNNAIIQLQVGDYFGCEETSISALQFLKEPKDNDYLLSVYNTIAIARKNLKDYKTAINWYKKALSISKEPSEKLTIENNIAVVYTKSKEYQKAISIFENLLKDKNVNKNIATKSKIIDNLAYTKFLQNKNYNSEPELLNALQIREKEKDLWGQNASHAHLSDYFADKDSERSLFHAQKMYKTAKNLKSPDDQLEALQKLIKLDSKNYQKYFTQFQSLNDSLQTARNKAKNQFALIRYDAEKNRADFLKSQAENAQNQNRILVRNIALLLSFLAIILGIFWYRKRKKRLEQEKEILKQEKEIEVKNTQLKYSKKVHDVVANGLYQTMVEIENQPELNKERVLNNIEKLYEESRDITQDDFTETPDKEFSTQLSQMISSYNSDSQKIFIAGNEQKLWEDVSPNIQSELYYVIRELLVNMKKHSHAKLISFKFEKNEEILKIKYVDNGIGISDLGVKTGSGIKNTENRIATIGGEINFEKNPKGGLIVNISVPIH